MSFQTGIIFNKTRVKKPREWQVTIVSTYVIDVIADNAEAAENKAHNLFQNWPKDYHTETTVVNVLQVTQKNTPATGDVKGG